GPKKGTVQSWDKVYSIEIEKALGDISIDDFDMLIIPGGSSPAKMREIPEVVDFTINFYNTGKTVASICHGPQLLAATGILNGVNATGVSDIQEELEAAGAFYINEAVVVDNNLITSRDPDDIPSFIVAVADAVINQK
ncbi:MAG TPA: protease, partial [Fermentimonas caenicola]|nr:protease [Fermentimonas caenicola]